MELLVYWTEQWSHFRTCNRGGHFLCSPVSGRYQYRSLNAYQSAIAYMHTHNVQMSVGQHPLVSWLKGSIPFLASSSEVHRNTEYGKGSIPPSTIGHQRLLFSEGLFRAYSHDSGSDMSFTIVRPHKIQPQGLKDLFRRGNVLTPRTCQAVPSRKGNEGLFLS